MVVRENSSQELFREQNGPEIADRPGACLEGEKSVPAFQVSQTGLQELPANERYGNFIRRTAVYPV